MSNRDREGQGEREVEEGEEKERGKRKKEGGGEKDARSTRLECGVDRNVPTNL